MYLDVIVQARGQYFEGGSAIKIEEPLVRMFEPHKVCNDNLLRMYSGEAAPESRKVVMKLRKEAAAEIAKALTERLVYEMSKLDTTDGYKDHE